MLVTGPKPVMRVPGAGGEAEMGGPEKYDSYLTKLQNICTEQVGEDSQAGPGPPPSPSPSPSSPRYKTYPCFQHPHDTAATKNICRI